MNKIAQFIIKIPQRSIILFLYFYEAYVAPIFARYFFFLFFPFYELFKKKHFFFLFNICDGVGDNIPALDNFFRAIILKEADTKNKYIFIRRNNDFCRTVVKLYGKRFYFSAASNFLYCLILPMLMRYRDITVDVGLSRCKWYLPKNKYSLPPRWQTNLYMEKKEETQQKWISWYKRRYLSENVNLLKFPAQNQKLNQLGVTPNKKIALIHIKSSIVNATAKITDPDSYLETLSFLIQEGFQLIFVGREKMPTVFEKYGVYNYANSSKASFMNDLLLFNSATIAITAGSGISYLADCYETPCLYLNSWHIFKPPFSRFCVYVPSLISDRRGKTFSFTEQSNLYYNLQDRHNEIFPATTYEAINASSDDILAGTMELLELIDNYTELSSEQKMFQQLDANGWLKYAQSRISQNFLEKHLNLL